jgi:FkbM family methyltransferase
VQRAVSELCGAGAVFYDVGGGFGLYSLLAARNGAEVFVFEPFSRNAASIRSHARMNGLEAAIHVVPEAAHSESGRLRLMLTHRGSQMAPVGADDGGTTMEVSCITLDEFARAHPAPSLIKVDVEGAEAEVLRGAREIFERSRPRLICEVHDAENRALVLEWLRERRYSVRWLEPAAEDQRHLLAEPEEGARRTAGTPSP